jgi:hypothetical protein
MRNLESLSTYSESSPSGPRFKPLDKLALLFDGLGTGCNVPFGVVKLVE